MSNHKAKYVMCSYFSMTHTEMIYVHIYILRIASEGGMMERAKITIQGPQVWCLRLSVHGRVWHNTHLSTKCKNAEFVELCIVITTSGFFSLKSKVFCESFLCVWYIFSREKIGFNNHFFTFLTPTLKYSGVFIWHYFQLDNFHL